MAIENCLILAAGMGTRMGVVGEILPKPLWPLGDMTCLSYQYEIARSLGVKKIYTNVFHRSAEIIEYIRKKELRIEVLKESELLDIGGTIQNMVNNGIRGNCLILNSDQLIENHDYHLVNLIKKKPTSCLATLATVNVNSEAPYNRLIVGHGLLKGVRKFKDAKASENLTYAGLGVIDLSMISRDDDLKKRNFFDLILAQDNNRVNLEGFNQDIFFDVGKKDKYIEFIFGSLVENKFPKLKIEKYFRDGFFNFSKCAWSEAPAGTVVISGDYQKLETRCICLDGVIDPY